MASSFFESTKEGGEKKSVTNRKILFQRKNVEARQVSSMIHSARSRVLRTLFSLEICFVLKSDTYTRIADMCKNNDHHRTVTEGRPRGSIDGGRPNAPRIRPRPLNSHFSLNLQSNYSFLRLFTLTGFP